MNFWFSRVGKQHLAGLVFREMIISGNYQRFGFSWLCSLTGLADSGRIADALVSGQMKMIEVAKLQKLVDNAKVTGEFKSHLLTAIESESPSFLNAESYFGGENA